MNAERFYGDADGPDMVIDRATDGAPLKEYRGWMCGKCESIFTLCDAAEACCVGPTIIGKASTPRSGRLRIFRAEDA